VAKGRRGFGRADIGEEAFEPLDSADQSLDPDLEEFWISGSEALESDLRAVTSAIEPGDSVVEIGCGVGRITRALAAEASSVRALDPSAAMIHRAWRLNAHLQDVEFIVGDGSTLRPLADSSAGVVYSHDFLKTVSDSAVALGYVREIGRVLRPGGWALFHISNTTEAKERRRALGALVRSIEALAGRAPKKPSRPQRPGPLIGLEQLAQAAAAGGTDVSRVADEGTASCLIRLDKPVAS
jgi:SAM-dependent methyltransferase